MKRLSILSGSAAALALTLGLAATAPAQEGIPNKPYSQWTPEEQQSAAHTIGAMCQAKCLPYTNGGQRGAFEAEACTAACFVNYLPADYPNIAALKSMAWQNYEQAKNMGSLNAPPPFSR